MKNIYVICFIALLIAGSFVLFQNDEKYLKKHTIKLLHIVSPSSTPSSTATMFRKIHEIAKYMHFSVEYEVKTEQYFYKNQSLANLRSALAGYFKQPDKNWRINIPSAKELNVTISKSEENKTAEVSFTVKATQGNKKLSCNSLINWIKEKKWLIHKIKVFSCSSNP